MRVASRVLQFTIPVLVVVGLGADVVVIGIVSMVMGIDVLAVIGIVVRGIDVLAVIGVMVRGIDVLVVIGIVVRGIDVLAVDNVVVVSDGEVGYIVPFAGAMFFREISPLGVCSCTMTC